MPSFKSLHSHRVLRIAAGFAVLIMVSAGVRQLSGSTPRASGPGTTVASSAVPVTAAVAIRRDVPDIVNAIGTVQSIDAVAVQPRVTGSIVEVEFTPGQDVKRGQELFLIDPRPFKAALSQARGQLAHDEGLLGEAQMDLTRFQNLAKENAIDKQQEQDQVYVVQQDKGTVDLDQANVETAELNLQYCHVASPIDGRAGALLVDLGNLVGPQSAGQAPSNTAAGSTTTGEQTSVGDTLVSITQLQPIHVDFNVPQTLLNEIKGNQAASALAVDAYSQAGKLLEKGKLSLIDNQVNPSTGTVLLQGTFANDRESLWPGEFVTLKLVVAMRRNVVTLPAQAVIAGPSGSYVYVISADNKVHRVDIQITARQGGVAVIKKGVSAGEKIVANGQYRLADGVSVDVRQDTQAG